ncbi:MAG: hypothetical protein ABI846_01495 [Rudaea sp.]
MSRSRLSLHLAALLLPLAAAALFALMVDRDPAFVLRMAAYFGGAGALAAQVAALVRWPALERRAAAGWGGWLAGLGMAAITHVLFGMFVVIGLALAVGDWQHGAGTGKPFDLVLQALFFVAVSVMPLGALTFPLSAGLAEIVSRMRHRELADVVR